MSDMRRLIQSMDNIMEIDMRSTRPGQQGLDVPNIEGGIGGGGSISTGLGSAVGKALPKVWKNPRTGQTSSTPPAGVRPTPQPLPAGAIARPAQQPLPAGVQPSTAGAGRGSINPTARDPLGRREPGSAPVDGRTPPIKPPEEKITKGDVAKSVAGHAALAAALYQGDKQEPGQPKGGGGGGESGDPAGSPPPVPPQADLYKPEDLKVLGIEPGSIDIKDPDIKLPSSNVAKPITTTTASSEIDVPKVGPQGPNSPFVVTKPEIVKPQPQPIQTKPEIVKPQPQPIPQIQPQPQAATPPINRPQTKPSISPSTSDILGRMQGAGSGGTGGNAGNTGAGGAGGGGGGGVGSGQGPGSGAGAGPGTGGGSVGGSGAGSSTAPSNPSGSDDPFPMMRHKLKRTNEHRSVNKLVKEFKQFVNRKI
jgi:hypothetical protein